MTTTERGMGWDYQKVAGPIRRAGVGRPCPRCGALMSANRRTRWASTVDHIVPRVFGGSNHPSNLMAVCRLCNFGAGARYRNRRRALIRAVTGNPSRQW